jgi:hypothetical protein
MNQPLPVRSLRPLWMIARRCVYLWVGAIFLVLGFVFLSIGIGTTFQEHAYKSRGLGVRAVVLEKTLIRADRQEQLRTRNLLAYHFVSANGEAKQGTVEVPVEQWEAVEPGKTFALTYLPEEAETGRVLNGDEWIAGLVFSLVGGVFALLGGALAFVDGRMLVRTARLLRGGVTTEGTVLRVGPTGLSINRIPQWRIHYRYRDQLGRTYEGQSHPVSPEEGSAWMVGDKANVRFDRRRPENSLWPGRS